MESTTYKCAPRKTPNRTATIYPGTSLRLVYEILPGPAPKSPSGPSKNCHSTLTTTGSLTISGPVRGLWGTPHPLALGFWSNTYEGCLAAANSLLGSLESIRLLASSAGSVG